MKTNKTLLWTGIILLIAGTILAIVFSWAHYYTLFSIGALFVSLEVYKKISNKSIFDKWGTREHSLFWISLIIISIFIDRFGIDAGYWIYPHYSTLFDEIFKIVFEWAVPFVYFMVSLMIGVKLFNKKLNKDISIILSLIVGITIIGFFTEWVNHFVYSWEILKMPISNLKINDYFIMFQTLGYWAIAIIPYLIYDIIENQKK